MKEFSLTVKAEQLGIDLKNFTNGVIKVLEQGVGNIAESAYDKIRKTAVQRLFNKSYSNQYLNALQFQRLDKHSWLIELKGEFATKIEEGSAGFDMRDILLKSKSKVSAGPRAGEPWVRTSKKGYKYAQVPVQKFRKPAGGDLASTLRSLEAIGRNGIKQTIDKIFKDVNTGKPLQGRVAVATSSDIAISNRLEGLTKYQTTKGKRTNSLYILYRGISQNPEKSRGWRNPGFKSINAFHGIEEYINQQFDILLKEINGKK